MKESLVYMVNKEEVVAIKKWGSIDKYPTDLVSAAIEELGEVAHAINHDEGECAVVQEIVETIGILSRLYNMITHQM